MKAICKEKQMPLKWSYLSQVAAVVCLQLNRFLRLFFSDGLRSRDPELLAILPGAGGLTPGIPAKFHVWWQPPAHLRAPQFLREAMIHRGGWMPLQGPSRRSAMGAPSWAKWLPPIQFIRFVKFFLKSCYIRLLKSANFFCLCIKRAFKCRFSALHIKLC